MLSCYIHTWWHCCLNVLKNTTLQEYNFISQYGICFRSRSLPRSLSLAGITTQVTSSLILSAIYLAAASLSRAVLLRVFFSILPLFKVLPSRLFPLLAPIGLYKVKVCTQHCEKGIIVPTDPNLRDFTSLKIYLT